MIKGMFKGVDKERSEMYKTKADFYKMMSDYYALEENEQRIFMAVYRQIIENRKH